MLEKVKETHRDVIAPIMNAGSLAIGSAYPIPISHSSVESAEFIFQGTAAPTVFGTDPRPERGKWSLKIKPVGFEPFRIEEDGRSQFAHVNTSDPNYDHIRLNIPTSYLETYGAVGSAAAGYYEPEGNKNLPELLKGHFDWFGL